MKPWLKWVLIGAGAVAAYQTTIFFVELDERRRVSAQSLAYCRSIGKPYLVVGMRMYARHPDDGDVTLDVNPEVLNQPGGVVGDVRDMPFANKQFGVCYCAHVLEHMYSIEDVQRAVAECTRVADYAAFLCPSPYSLVNLIHPTHHLRVWFDSSTDTIYTCPNNWRSPILLGTDYDRAPAVPHQVMIVDHAPFIRERT